MVSVCDAVYGGLTGRDAVWDEQSGQPWAIVVVSLLLTAVFGLLAAVLVQQADRIDASSRFIRWVRRLLLCDLTLLAATFAAGTALTRVSDALTAPAGIAFILMFLLGAILGVALLRRRELRLPAMLMAAPIVLIPLTALVTSIDPDWTHPGYAETALYLGLALLGRHPGRHTTPATEHRTPVTAQL